MSAVCRSAIRACSGSQRPSGARDKGKLVERRGRKTTRLKRGAPCHACRVTEWCYCQRPTVKFRDTMTQPPLHREPRRFYHTHPWRSNIASSVIGAVVIDCGLGVIRPVWLWFVALQSAPLVVSVEGSLIAITIWHAGMCAVHYRKRLFGGVHTSELLTVRRELH